MCIIQKSKLSVSDTNTHTLMDTFRAKGSRSNLSSPGDCGNDVPRPLMVSLPLQDNLSVPLTEEDLDGSSGVLFPFYDSDTSMLYIVGKVSLARWEAEIA